MLYSGPFRALVHWHDRLASDDPTAMWVFLCAPWRGQFIVPLLALSCGVLRHTTGFGVVRVLWSIDRQQVGVPNWFQELWHVSWLALAVFAWRDAALDGAFPIMATCLIVGLVVTMGAVCSFAFIPAATAYLGAVVLALPLEQVGPWIVVLRIYGLVVHSIDYAVFQRFRDHLLLGAPHPVKGNYRSLVFGLLVYAELLLWFATLYSHHACSFVDKGGALASSDGCLYFSLVTMTTLGYGDISPTSQIGRNLVTAQTAIGVTMVVAILAQMVSSLPKPAEAGRDA